jgi:hypothetical protein
MLADLVEGGRRRPALAGAQLVAPAVAQGAQEVAQLVASRQETGASEDGGVGVLNEVLCEVGITAEGAGGGVEPVQVADRLVGVEASWHSWRTWGGAACSQESRISYR